MTQARLAQLRANLADAELEAALPKPGDVVIPAVVASRRDTVIIREAARGVYEAAAGWLAPGARRGKPPWTHWRPNWRATNEMPVG